MPNLFEYIQLDNPTWVWLKVFDTLDKGASYALVALGLTLIFGTLGLVNFAHGTLLMLGAFVAVITVAELGLPIYFAFLAVPLIMFAVGISLERGLVRHLYHRPHTEQIMVTFGLAVILEELIRWIFGANPIPISLPSWLEGSYLLFIDFPEIFSVGVVYRKWALLSLIISSLLVGGLFLFLQFTRFGMVIRAGMRDPETLTLLGINIRQRFMVVFGIGAVMAGYAGLMRSGFEGPSAALGFDFLVPAFVVVVIGGMGSLAGAVLAAFLLGFVQAFSSDIPGGLPSVIIYITAVVVLLVRPRGFLGKRGLME